MDEKKLIGHRFAEERARLGYSIQELAVLCETTRQLISRLEKGGNYPASEVLLRFAQAGADIRFVLTGEREGRINHDLYGVCEAALKHEYELLKGRPVTQPLRSRAIATIYNQLVGRISAGSDEVMPARRAARDMLESYDDPSIAFMLERNLFAPPPAAQESATTVTGDNNRVAGRDYHER